MGSGALSSTGGELWIKSCYVPKKILLRGVGKNSLLPPFAVPLPPSFVLYTNATNLYFRDKTPTSHFLNTYSAEGLTRIISFNFHTLS